MMLNYVAARVLGATVVFLFVGLWLMPDHLFAALMVVVCAVGGVILLPSSPTIGIALLVAAGGFAALGVNRWRNHQREEQAHANEAAKRSRRGEQFWR